MILCKSAYTNHLNLNNFLEIVILFVAIVQINRDNFEFTLDICSKIYNRLQVNHSRQTS